MSCEKHKKEIAGISDMKALAEMIGDLHYETLTKLMMQIGKKLDRDWKKDNEAGRQNLAQSLLNARTHISSAAFWINEAWTISKPFMESKEEAGEDHEK